MADTDKKEVAEKDEAKSVRGFRSDHTLVVVGLIAALIFVLLIGIGIGGWRHRNLVSVRSVSMTGGIAGPRVGGGRFFVGSGGYAGGNTSNSSDRVSGVVTAVNGADFTVAGYGSTTNVVTNSSTQYQDGSTVKVDDTVTVLGTTSDGSLTATSVVINP